MTAPIAPLQTWKWRAESAERKLAEAEPRIECGVPWPSPCANTLIDCRYHAHVKLQRSEADAAELRRLLRKVLDEAKVQAHTIDCWWLPATPTPGCFGCEAEAYLAGAPKE